jgi:hypothetical protein
MNYPPLKTPFEMPLAMSQAILVPTTALPQYVYYSSEKGEHAPRYFAQFFGPENSAKSYALEREQEQERERGRKMPVYYVHRYRLVNTPHLLNLTPDSEHPDAKTRNHHLNAFFTNLALFIEKVTPQLTNTEGIPLSRDPSTVTEIVNLNQWRLVLSKFLIRLLFGVGLPLLAEKDIVQMINASVEHPLWLKEATMGTDQIPLDRLVEFYVDMEQSQCTTTRTSFRNVDKTLMNVLTLLFEQYTVPINGIKFDTMGYPEPAPHPNGYCCQRGYVDGNLCVTPEIILFRPNRNNISYDRPFDPKFDRPPIHYPEYVQYDRSKRANDLEYTYIFDPKELSRTSRLRRRRPQETPTQTRTPSQGTSGPSYIPAHRAGVRIPTLPPTTYSQAQTQAQTQAQAPAQQTPRTYATGRGRYEEWGRPTSKPWSQW